MREKHERHERKGGGRVARAKGGDVTDDKLWDAKGGENQQDKEKAPEKRNADNNVYREALERKDGGRATEKRHERKKRKHGGHVMAMEGKAAKHRLDRPGRKSGGGVGSNKTPLSTAARVRERVGDSEDLQTAGE